MNAACPCLCFSKVPDWLFLHRCCLCCECHQTTLASRHAYIRLMELPKSSTMQPPAADGYSKLRNWLQWALVAFCFFVTLYRLEMPCSPVHKSLNSIDHAKAEFHGAKAAGTQQLKPLPQDPDWCSTKPRDVSSWTRASAAQPPFQFPRIIHQTVEDKYNISCEVLECMQVGDSSGLQLASTGR